MMSSFFIYGLRDPHTAEIRYVGQSTRGMDRPREHFQPARSRGDSRHVAKWLRKLLNMQSLPEIVVLETIPSKDKKTLDEAEQRWIAIGRTALGERLTNHTDGGEGTIGWIHTQEARAKMLAHAQTPVGKAQLADRIEKGRTPEAREKRRVAKLLLAQTPQGQEGLRIRVAAAHTPEANRKRIESHRALSRLPERVAALADARVKSHTPEARAKRSASLRAFYAAKRAKASVE